MPSHLSGVGSTRVTPQSKPIPDRASEQLRNDAGGYVFKISPLDSLRRFLVLGTEGGTYYVDERKHTERAVRMVRSVLDTEGAKAVEEIARISFEGIAPKNENAIYALAMAAGHRDDAVRKAALEAIPRVCRTGTHLFQYVTFVQEFRGWGRGLRKAVGAWYTGMEPDKLAYQAVKYRQRDGWTHDDVLRLAHVAADDPTQAAVLEWITKPKDGSRRPVGDLPRIIEGFERAQAASSPAESARLVREYRLPREALLTEHLNEADVWLAMLETGMPITALVRNLATMTRNGVVAPMSAGLKMVLDALGDAEKIRKGRVHPISLLGALVTYQSGRSARGSATWAPVPQVVDALDAAFYSAFAAVEPTGKNHLLALDVSTSMRNAPIAAMPGLNARVASAAMALVTAAVEPMHEIVGFTGSGGFYGRTNTTLKRLNISARQRLDDVVRTIDAEDFGATDCALPMLYATREKLDVDTFVIYTDNESWAGEIHASQALEQYRQMSGKPAKLVVAAMSATDYSVADPTDPGMLDVVGFDPTAPAVMADFSAGRL